MAVVRMYAIILAITIAALPGGVVEACFGTQSYHAIHNSGRQSELMGRRLSSPFRATTERHEATILWTESADNIMKPLSSRSDFCRRSWLEQVATTNAALASLVIGMGWSSSVPIAWADESVTSETTTSSDEFVRQGPDYGYAIRLPKDFEQTQKPLKTHLDEINFISPTVKGYQVGITVDPVRINSLREFGTPEEVAAKVVLAEVNRDGVFDVTLIQDPVEVPGGGYLLDYLSQGKRGDKHFVVKVGIQRQKLYVLTAQAPEEVYSGVAPEIMKFVNSFRLL